MNPDPNLVMEALAEELRMYRTLDRDDFAVQELIAAAMAADACEHVEPSESAFAAGWCFTYHHELPCEGDRLRAALKPFEEQP